MLARGEEESSVSVTWSTGRRKTVYISTGFANLPLNNYFLTTLVQLWAAGSVRAAAPILHKNFKAVLFVALDVRGKGEKVDRSSRRE